MHVDVLTPTQDSASATPGRARGRKGWDRVNFGRVLRQLRAQAHLTQDELGERMGRDRRRVLVLEQGTAVREPGPTELGVLAAALGGASARGELERAAHPDGPAISAEDCSPREQVHRRLASDFNRLLSRVDEVRFGARSLSRSIDQLFDESLISAQVVQRSRCAVVSILAGVLAELHRQTRYVKRSLDTPMGRDTWVETIVEFRQRQSLYWSRCASEAWQVQEADESNSMERWLDSLEMGTFHLHPGVSQPATTAKRALGHLFLFWAELAMRAAADVEAAASLKVTTTPRAGEHQPGVAFHRFTKALQSFEDLALIPFAEQLFYREAPETARHDIGQVHYLWEKLSEELPGVAVADNLGRVQQRWSA